ncbi:phosphatase PAP2 family protein [Thiobacillus sp.]
MSLSPAYPWLVITQLGAASIMLPVFLVTTAGLWLAGQKSALLAWLAAMAVGVSIVLVNKIAFIGWGWGSGSLNFTGISGHTMLATSIFPIWISQLLVRSGRRFSLSGILLGLAIGATVSISRLVLGAHSPSEVIAGWLLGLAIITVVCRTMKGQRPTHGVTGLAGVFMLLALNPSLSVYFPTHKWEVKLALALSGRTQPYIRQDLHRTLRSEAR